MKNPDREQFEPLLIKLIVNRCAGTLACNSIKLRFEAYSSNKKYIWIDPPWDFLWKNHKITDSSESPLHKKEDYHLKFRTWCKLFSPLDSILFINYYFNSKDDLILGFDKGYKIVVPFTIPDPEESLWYFHWYAYENIISILENS